MSPHVTIYKFPFAAVASITNRFAGVTMTVGFFGMGLLSFPGLFAPSVLPATISFIQAMPVMYIPLKMLTEFALVYHLVKSLMIVRVGKSVSVPQVNNIGKLAFGLAGVFVA